MCSQSSEAALAQTGSALRTIPGTSTWRKEIMEDEEGGGGSTQTVKV